MCRRDGTGKERVQVKRGGTTGQGQVSPRCAHAGWAASAPPPHREYCCARGASREVDSRRAAAPRQRAHPLLRRHPTNTRPVPATMAKMPGASMPHSLHMESVRGSEGGMSWWSDGRQAVHLQRAPAAPTLQPLQLTGRHLCRRPSARWLPAACWPPARPASAGAVGQGRRWISRAFMLATLPCPTATQTVTQPAAHTAPNTPLLCGQRSGLGRRTACQWDRPQTAAAPPAPQRCPHLRQHGVVGAGQGWRQNGQGAAGRGRAARWQARHTTAGTHQWRRRARPPPAWPSHWQSACGAPRGAR